MTEALQHPSGVYIHPNALVETLSVGRGTRIWAFSNILSGAKIGEDCNICDHTFIEGGVQLGDRVTVKCGVYLWNGITIEDDVFLGPNATFTNDRNPRSRQWQKMDTPTIVRKGATIGAAAAILAGIEVGSFAMVGMGAVVTRNIPAFALAYGNPAKLLGFVSHLGQQLKIDGNLGICPSSGKKYRIEGIVCKPLDD